MNNTKIYLSRKILINRQISYIRSFTNDIHLMFKVWLSRFKIHQNMKMDFLLILNMKNADMWFLMLLSLMKHQQKSQFFNIPKFLKVIKSLIFLHRLLSLFSLKCSKFMYNQAWGNFYKYYVTIFLIKQKMSDYSTVGSKEKRNKNKFFRKCKV